MGKPRIMPATAYQKAGLRGRGNAWRRILQLKDAVHEIAPGRDCVATIRAFETGLTEARGVLEDRGNRRSGFLHRHMGNLSRNIGNALPEEVVFGTFGTPRVVGLAFLLQRFSHVGYARPFVEQAPRRVLGIPLQFVDPRPELFGLGPKQCDLDLLGLLVSVSSLMSSAALASSASR